MQVTLESAFTDARILCNPEAEEAAGATPRLALFAATGGAAYGFTMGLNHPGHPWLQAATSAAKVPIRSRSSAVSRGGSDAAKRS